MRARLRVLLFALAVACHKAPPPAPELPVVEPPVAAPEGRVVDLALASPNALWSRVQRGVGGMVAILPSTFGGLICTAAGLDVAFAAEIDGTAPAFAVIALDEGNGGFVVAARLRDAGRARAALVGGDTARFDARDAGAMTLVVPKGSVGPAAASALAVGLVGSGAHAYLLVAGSEAALTRLGPYAYRTLPTGPVPTSGRVALVAHDALAGTLPAEAHRMWTGARAEALRNDAEVRASHGGRAPDFGDAPAIVATVDSVVARATAVAASLDSLRLALDADADSLHVELVLTPAAGGGPAGDVLTAMTLGDATPLATIAPQALVGLVTRQGAESRAQDGASLEATLLAALGPRLRPDDVKKVHAAVTDWESARGDWLTAAVVSDREMGTGLLLRTPASDGQKAAGAVREAMELLTLPAFQAPLRSLFSVSGPTFSQAIPAMLEGPPLQHAGLALLRREPAKASNDRTAGVAWGIAGSDLLVAAGQDPRALLATAGAHAVDPAMAPALQALALGREQETSFALVARPFASAASGPPQKEPLVLAWGRHGGAGWARVDVSDLLVRELVRRQAGL